MAFSNTLSAHIKLLLVTRLEKAMSPHSSTPAWKIPWTEDPGGLQSMGSLRVGHDWVTSLSLFTFMHWRNGNPLQCSCLENPRDRGAWWAAVYGVTQSWTWLKRLSSSMSTDCNIILILYNFFAVYLPRPKWRDESSARCLIEILPFEILPLKREWQT